MVQQVPENISFPNEEEKILELWKKLNCFQECLKQSKNRPRFNFYDGPPFATGLPHYGHILAGTIKDIVTRFAHQSGFHVDRRFGWDCHGLPVEYEIDKTLGIKGPEDVAKMGIAEYNNQCRGIVMRYSKEWEFNVTRLGRWIDFENDYKTLYPEFMESVWWVFKQLYDKGLVYRGVKVMPFSTACNTPLSNFESHQNYKDVQDPSVIVSFPLVEDASVSLVAWTTTPWTLPSNLALCVNPELQYAKLRDKATGKIYILMESRLIALYKSDSEYEILDRFPGIVLKGKKYKPLFEYFIQCKDKGAFTVLVDSYVKEEEGTGVVHQAPYFGADDYRVCMDFNIIQKDSVPVCPVDVSGCFTAEVTDFAGQYVKDADKNIIKLLKEKGRLVHSSTYKHSYPFCWRSDTPLIYKAVPSWFVRVEHMVEKLLENNAQCYWVPDFVREKRFGNWLKDARDWAISRNRYWGTPIPLWVSGDFEEVVCIGSMAELEELSGVKVTDLHRESIDHLTIPSRCGKGVLRRVPEVFDCWFESGSMPYAQVHYPFENKKELEDAFPADFIAEGIDQTRGWFYTLLVLSTALFGRPPFKNVIVNGLVLARLVCKFFAKLIRVQRVLKTNEIRNVVVDDEGREFLYNENTVKESNNIMDKWILSFTQSLVQFFKAEMAAYRLYTVVPRLVKFVDILTNWYVRMNRRRLKGENGTEDCIMALETLFSVLFSMCRLMAPYTPFITELMYQNLKTLIDPASVQEKNTESIHYLMLPPVREDLIDREIESAVSCLQSVIELGRVIRDRKTIPVKYPLKEVVVIHQDPEALENIRCLEKYILEVRTSSTYQWLRKLCFLFPALLKFGFQQQSSFIDWLTLSTQDLKGSELEITLVRGGLCERVGPACSYVNLKVCVNGTEQDGVLLLENPKGDNTLNLTGFVDAVSCIFGLKNSKLTVFNGETELINKTDLLSLSGKTLHVTTGSAPALINSPDALLCQYINLQLVNAKPQECQKGTVGTLLMENPVGQNGLTYHGLLHETAKVFGKSTNCLLYLFLLFGSEITKDISMKNLNMKTVYVSVIPTTAEC
uniref:isoleucine--tRNA ligase n=1 Tax=Pavo cristatus TaxID=9049 RepID=A0A8C9FQ08_PAVCR